MLNHIRDIVAPPILKLNAIVILGLTMIPNIKRFDHHHHTHLIAEFNEFRCRHVMTGANSIASHIFEHGNLMTQCILVDSHTERT